MGLEFGGSATGAQRDISSCVQMSGKNKGQTHSRMLMV